MLGMMLGGLWFGGTPALEATEETPPSETTQSAQSDSALTFTARLPAAENASTLNVEELFWPGPTEPTEEDLKCLRSWQVCQMSSHPADMLERGVVQPLVLEIHVGGMRLNGEDVLEFHEGLRLAKGETKGPLLVRLHDATHQQYVRWSEMLGVSPEAEERPPATALLVVDEAVPSVMLQRALYSIGTAGVSTFAYLVDDPKPTPPIPPLPGRGAAWLELTSASATLHEGHGYGGDRTTVEAPEFLEEASRSLLPRTPSCIFVAPTSDVPHGTQVQYLDQLAALGAPNHQLAGGTRAEGPIVLESPTPPPPAWTLDLSRPLAVFRTGLPEVGPDRTLKCWDAL